MSWATGEPWVPEPIQAVMPNRCELCGGRRKDFQTVRSELTGDWMTVCDTCVAEYGYDNEEEV